MIRSLYSAAGGMLAQQIQLDVVANNLANVNTTGFKKSRAEFADLFYQILYPRATGSRIEVGAGVRPVATTRIFTGGPLNPTGQPLDLAIEGDGFFMVEDGDGNTFYTRSGSFREDAEGNIVNAEGYKLLEDGGSPLDSVPADAVSVSVSADGTVYAYVDADTQPKELGQVGLARFPNPSGLLAVGGSLLKETDASGRPTEGTPGSGGFGRVLSGFLEGSNVEVAVEMVNLIVAQRAYELNAKAVQAADEAIGLANNLRRG